MARFDTHKSVTSFTSECRLPSDYLTTRKNHNNTGLKLTQNSVFNKWRMPVSSAVVQFIDAMWVPAIRSSPKRWFNLQNKQNKLSYFASCSNGNLKSYSCHWDHRETCNNFQTPNNLTWFEQTCTIQRTVPISSASKKTCSLILSQHYKIIFERKSTEFQAVWNSPPNSFRPCVIGLH
jgi:hypothetical protein